uniref:Uncharacterized protein n=1 Tax=Brassica oleracea TaxID=3712 RepID=A0A3P6BX43_BRAOL|nr:unnamed protein product [Brassica oleracea]
MRKKARLTDVYAWTKQDATMHAFLMSISQEVIADT